MITCWYDKLGSTSTRAIEFARLNPGTPLLVAANTQTAGRGRTGRTWHSPRGGAWFSLALSVQANPMHMRPAPLVAGLAVLQTLEPLLSDDNAPAFDTGLCIKWPNDVLLHDRKVAGILCEQTLHPADPPEHWRIDLIIGAGINVNVDVARFDNDLRHPATSLQEALGRDIALQPLIRNCAEAIQRQMLKLMHQGFNAETRRAVRKRLAWIGNDIVVSRLGREVFGEMRGIDALGRLLIDTEHGLETFDAGDVQTVRTADAVGP
ncbi:MAG: biotin--[acetyl-CoA-carboxylase] ligase [Rhodospirillales bacterium]|nr:biotin--[acetyl-CoA-carboxylase] ligase [Rhodospirillales bacterium]